MNDTMTRKTIFFQGNVQGVGFRYTTTHVARRFDVAGYVQNLEDGRVKLVAEGDDQELRHFIDAVRERMSRHIRDHRVEPGEPTGEFGDPAAPDTFTIKY